MNLTYETERLILRVETAVCAPKVLEFYRSNRAYFDAWEITRADNFYSEAYQTASLNIEYNEMVKKHMVRYFLYDKVAYEQDANATPIIGSVSLSDIRMGGFKRAMFGYKLDHEHWGKGLATEACEKLISIAKDDLRLHRLEAFIMPANEHSIHLIEKLGFSYEGTDRLSIEVNHQYEDHQRYALILQ